MNGVIVYQSKYGSTQQYAEWLSESLRLKLIDVKKISLSDLDSFDLLIFCSPVYYGKLLIAGFIKKNWNLFKGKKKYLVIAAGTDEQATDDIKNMLNANLNQDMLNQIKWSYLGGRMDIEKLSLFEKFIIKRLAKLIKDEKEKKKLQNGYNFVNRDKLNAVIEMIKEDNR